MAGAVIQVSGVKELRSACKAMEDKCGVAELKEAHAKAAELVRATATAAMPHVSGTLAGSYKAKGTQTGGYVESKLDYASVHEFGGRVVWRGKVYQRDTKGRVFRAKRHVVWVKPRAGSKDSYYIYPAIRQHEDEIKAVYCDEIYRIAQRLFA